MELHHPHARAVRNDTASIGDTGGYFAKGDGLRGGKPRSLAHAGGGDFPWYAQRLGEAQADIIGNIYDDNFHFGANLAIAPNINELEEKCQRCWAKHICSGGCPAQKLSLSRKAEQSLPEANCGIEKILSEFYLKVYTLFKQTRQCGN